MIAASDIVSVSASGARLGWIVPAGVVALALLVGAVHLTDETYLGLGGDTSRYLMNGVFFLDLAHDASIASRDFREYAVQYYSRYPALSLGFHPVLPSLLVVPVFALFGISVSSARVVPLVSFATASFLLLLLVERIYDRWMAFVATMIFVSSPFAARYSRSFLSEMPALSMVMLAVFFCERYRESNRRLDLGLFIGFAVVSLYGKQLTVLMLPVYAVYLVWRAGGLGRFMSVRFVAGAIVAALVLVPLLPMTLALSRHNVRWVTQVAAGRAQFDYLAILIKALVGQATWPIIMLATIGLLRSLWTRDERSTLFILWVSAFALLVVFVIKDVGADRYTIFWVPAVCTLAAAGATGWRSKPLRYGALGVLTVCVAWEAITASKVHLAGAGGYEETARYVVHQTRGKATVLFSGDLDTGYFVFFVRKHDPNRSLVVLRSDKLLTTSNMANVAYKEQIEPEQIDGILNEFGTQFVVIEDRPSTSRVLEWLRNRVKRPPYVERLRVPLRSSDDRLKNDVDLAVFENVGVSPPNPDAKMRLDLPVAGLVINSRLGDVLAGPGRRELTRRTGGS